MPCSKCRQKKCPEEKGKAVKKDAKLLKEIELTRQLIKLVGKDYGRDKCPGYHPDCANCKGQIFLGHLGAHLDFLKWQKGWEGKLEGKIGGKNEKKT